MAAVHTTVHIAVPVRGQEVPSDDAPIETLCRSRTVLYSGEVFSVWVQLRRTSACILDPHTWLRRARAVKLDAKIVTEKQSSLRLVLTQCSSCVLFESPAAVVHELRIRTIVPHNLQRSPMMIHVSVHASSTQLSLADATSLLTGDVARIPQTPATVRAFADSAIDADTRSLLTSFSNLDIDDPFVFGDQLYTYGPIVIYLPVDVSVKVHAPLNLLALTFSRAEVPMDDILDDAAICVRNVSLTDPCVGDPQSTPGESGRHALFVPMSSSSEGKQSNSSTTDCVVLSHGEKWTTAFRIVSSDAGPVHDALMHLQWVALPSTSTTESAIDSSKDVYVDYVQHEQTLRWKVGASPSVRLALQTDKSRRVVGDRFVMHCTLSNNTDRDGDYVVHVPAAPGALHISSRAIGVGVVSRNSAVAFDVPCEAVAPGAAFAPPIFVEDRLSGTRFRVAHEPEQILTIELS